VRAGDEDGMRVRRVPVPMPRVRVVVPRVRRGTAVHVDLPAPDLLIRAR
jgi:hypothetical protein